MELTRVRDGAAASGPPHPVSGVRTASGTGRRGRLDGRERGVTRHDRFEADVAAPDEQEPFTRPGMDDGPNGFSYTDSWLAAPVACGLL